MRAPPSSSHSHLTVSPSSLTDSVTTARAPAAARRSSRAPQRLGQVGHLAGVDQLVVEALPRPGRRGSAARRRAARRARSRSGRSGVATVVRLRPAASVVVVVDAAAQHVEAGRPERLVAHVDAERGGRARRRRPCRPPTAGRRSRRGSARGPRWYSAYSPMPNSSPNVYGQL